MEIVELKGRQFYANPPLLEELDILDKTHKGGFATICGYVATSKRTKPEVANINFTSRFSYKNLIEKKKELLKNLKFSDISLTSEKLLSLTKEKQHGQFEICRLKMLETIQKTLDGDRTDYYRKAHDEFYIHIQEGVKVKLQSEKSGNETFLVKKNGLPVASHIVVMGLELSRKVIQAGEHKKVNSGCKVLMDQAINKALKAKGVKTPKSFSLETGKYGMLKISGEVL